MILIKVHRDNAHQLVGFTVDGHAGYAEKGCDIVCAAVSTVAYNAINAAEEVANVKMKYKIRDGYMDVKLPYALCEEQKKVVRIVLETILVGFKYIQQNYDEYVSIMEEVKKK